MIQTLDLQFLFQISVELGDTLESEFVHHVHCFTIRHMFVSKLLYGNRERCWEKHDLSISLHIFENLLNNRHEILREQLISLIQCDYLTVRQICDIFLCQVQNSSGSCWRNVLRFSKFINVNDYLQQCAREYPCSKVWAHPPWMMYLQWRPWRSNQCTCPDPSQRNSLEVLTLALEPESVLRCGYFLCQSTP